MISVIIPYKNSSQWLGRCVKSLTMQQGDFEFIFINDNSEDNGSEIIKTLADNRCVLFDNEHGPGVSGARNTGLDHARGEWITFLDADDEYLPNAYDTFIQVLKTPAEFYQLNHMRYYTTIDKLVLKYDNVGGRYSVNKLPQIWFGVWNKLISKDLIKDVRFNENIQYGEDGLFCFECLAKTKYIQHASRYLTVVKHRFDNKKSLSHIKTADDALKRVREYEDFMMRQPDKEVKCAVIDELGRIWTSSITKKVFVDNKVI